MEISKIGDYTPNNEMVRSELERWLDHGYYLGATDAVLYFDRHENSQAMSYAFAPETREKLIDRLKGDGHQIIQAWHYER